MKIILNAWKNWKKSQWDLRVLKAPMPLRRQGNKGFCRSGKIDDFGVLQLAKNIADKIESELKYPGEIKVNVVRETRAAEYAR